MTLPNVAFFPQALLPLHIFEPRYQKMLQDVLRQDRLFAVAGLDAKQGAKTFEPLHRIATVGIVRACQKSQDGTSNLLIQGLARVEVLAILRESPYRQVRVRALMSDPGADNAENLRLRTSVQRLIRMKQRLGGDISQDFTRFLKTVEDPEMFVDLAAFNVCEDPLVKQKLLETLDVNQRLRLLGARLQADLEVIRLSKKLQGRLDDDAISYN